MQPGVMIISLMNEPAINCDVAYGVLGQRSGDIYSFLTGTRPRTLEQPEVDFGGFYSSFRDATIEDPTMFHSSAPCRGAALGTIPKRNLLSAAEHEPLPFQTRTPPPSASVAAPSMAELSMILKTLQSMVPEFPKLEVGELGTRPRRLQQWLLNVTQALEPAGHHVMSWWQWDRNSAECTHCIFLTKPLDQREIIFPPEPIPAHLAQVESWMRPRILACLPKII